MNEEVVKQIVDLARGWASIAGAPLYKGWEANETSMLTKECPSSRAFFRCSLEIMRTLHENGLIDSVYKKD